jgi:dienelactone hydrolase
MTQNQSQSLGYTAVASPSKAACCSTPPTLLPAFAREMGEAGVDWQLLSYGGSVHSFTDLAANNPGTSQYNAKVSRRAFAAMYVLLDEVFV